MRGPIYWGEDHPLNSSSVPNYGACERGADVSDKSIAKDAAELAQSETDKQPAKTPAEKPAEKPADKSTISWFSF